MKKTDEGLMLHGRGVEVSLRNVLSTLQLIEEL